jgi:putative heme transporter
MTARDPLRDLVGGDAQRFVARAGITAWSIVGAVVLTSIVVAVLGAISSVVLPLLFAAVLAVLFRPTAAWLEDRRVPPAFAAGGVVLGLVLAVVGVVALAVRGVADQTTRIGEQVARALEETGLSASQAADLRDSLDELAPAVTGGFVRLLVGGLDTVAGFAAGAVLGVLIMYYLLKDGPAIRRSMVGLAAPVHRAALDGFVDDSCLVLRRYGRGRTTLSAIVAFAVGAAGVVLGLPLVLTLVVVNFVGGYVPYIGAVVGGGLAVVVALADSGAPAAVVMLAVVLGANLLLENVVEPKVMGRTLDIHPLLVLVVTAVGGIVGGLVGLMLAVPVTVIVMRALARVHSGDVLRDLADRARPAVETLLAGPPAPTAEPRPTPETEENR